MMPEPSPGQPETGQKKVVEVADKTAYETVAGAYYRKAIEAPAAARTNSQNAYTIAAAVAAALVTAGAFADLADESLGIRALGIAALLAWLATAGLFMYAVSAPYRRLEDEPREVDSQLAFVKAAMANAENERNQINGRQSGARVLAGLASLLTVAVVALALFVPAASTAKQASVSPSPADRERLDQLCQVAVPEVVTGTVDTSSLDDGTIEFDPDKDLCKADGEVSLQEKRTVYVLAP